MKKIRIKLSSSCYDFGPGQWGHCTLEIKEVWKQKEKSTDSKELAGEQDFWGTWNAADLHLLCQKPPSAALTCHPLPNSFLALSLPYHQDLFVHSCLKWREYYHYFTWITSIAFQHCAGTEAQVRTTEAGVNLSQQQDYYTCLTNKHQVKTCKIQWFNKFISSFLNDF